MIIKSIHLYSHNEERRDIHFRKGLNIITGQSSTGKSTILNIVEYCLGESKFKVALSDLEDKVAWFAVIYQFPNEEILIAKRPPLKGKDQHSLSMLRRGSVLFPPEYKNLQENSKDDSVRIILSNMLGIPEMEVESSDEEEELYKGSEVQSSTGDLFNFNYIEDKEKNLEAYQNKHKTSLSIEHTFYYLFQKQTRITDNTRLFYQQNEGVAPQTIKNTFRCLFGNYRPDYLLLNNKLKIKKRELIRCEKHLRERDEFKNREKKQAEKLLLEARYAGLLLNNETENEQNKILLLRKLMESEKEFLSREPENNNYLALQLEIAKLRQDKKQIDEDIEKVRVYSQSENLFSSELGEHKARLSSIHAFPENPQTGKWQWSFFNKENLDCSKHSLILEELKRLDKSLENVRQEKPKITGYILKKEAEKEKLLDKIRSKTAELNILLSKEEDLKKTLQRNQKIYGLVGVIGFFLNSLSQEEENDFKNEKERLIFEIEKLRSQLQTSEEQNEYLSSVLSSISYKITEIIKSFKVEISRYPIRFDLEKLTLVSDQDVPRKMEKIGGADNQLALHISGLLGMHAIILEKRLSLPNFLFLDQPSQVYFPDNTDLNGSVEWTKSLIGKDKDLEAVRNMFKILDDFAKEYPDLQIIITEHANLEDEFFQNALIEPIWSKPPALVPEDWPSKSNIV